MVNESKPKEEPEEEKENWFKGLWSAKKVSPSTMPAENDVSFSDEQRDLDWSFRYLFFWMRLIGIQTLQQQTSELMRIFSIIFRTFIWFLIMGVNFVSFLTYIPSLKKTGKTTEFWNDFIECCNWLLHSVGVHSFVFFFALTKNRWKNFHESLVENVHCTRDSQHRQYLQSCNRIDFYKYRKLCTGGILYVLFSEGSELLVNIFTINEDSYSSKEGMILDVIALVMRIYTSTVIIYFCINCLVISDLFKLIGNEIDCIISTSRFTNLTNSSAIIDRLQIIKQKYLSIVSRCIVLLNDSFGPILLFELFYILVGITNELMIAMMEIKDFRGDLFVLSRLEHILLIGIFLSTLFLICYSAENINDQIASLKGKAYFLLVKIPSLQQEILSLIQVCELKSEINAAGFFSVNKTLIPTTLGLILTYVLILFQFYTGEK